LSTAVRVAPTELTVLIQGESGVGKEVFSKIIHSLSPRKHNKLIAINCGAIPEGTINSELFGHEKGSFTGATGERKGYFETVNGGTIFLDEIGEMPLDTQAYLLRILESGEFIRVGSSKVIKTDVRVIAATNISLEKKIANGKFREDLYYRLNTVPIRVPSLQARREDIHTLFRKFASDFAEKYRSNGILLDEKARALIENYKWPGNIRELKNVVEQLSVLSDQSLVTPEILIDLVPNIVERNLPAIRKNGEGGPQMYEREILYKLLFDMKKDFTELKSLIFELIRSNNLSVPDIARIKQLARDEKHSTDSFLKESGIGAAIPDPYEFDKMEQDEDDHSKPVIIHSNTSDPYQKMEIVEENLSLEDMEKDMIKKALKKHKGRRKDAADELGISERTLYRKIKQYEVE
jgi:DNA-binding NtrC family response regulator